MGRPVLFGRAKIDHGALANINFPNGLSDINGVIVFNQDRMQIQSLTANSGGGTLTLGGFVTYSGAPTFNLSGARQEHPAALPAGIEHGAGFRPAAERHHQQLDAVGHGDGHQVRHDAAIRPGAGDRARAAGAGGAEPEVAIQQHAAGGPRGVHAGIAGAVVAGAPDRRCGPQHSGHGDAARPAGQGEHHRGPGNAQRHELSTGARRCDLPQPGADRGRARRGGHDAGARLRHHARLPRAAGPAEHDLPLRPAAADLATSSRCWPSGVRARNR